MKRALLSVEEFENRFVPNAYVVENLSDDVATANSLRWCIKQANDNPGDDSITFDAAKCKGDTVQMASGQYLISGNVFIDGSLGEDKVVKIVGVKVASE